MHEVPMSVLLEIEYPNREGLLFFHAVRAFGGLFASHPRLMLILEQIGLIEALMSPDQDVKVQHASLTCWERILVVRLGCVYACFTVVSALV